MSRLPFLCVFGVIASVHLLKAQESGPSVSEYSNGGLEMTVEHAKPEPGVTWEGQNLYGILTIRLKNTSGEALRIVRGNPDCDFAIDLRDSSGNSPKRTPLGERLLPKSEEERDVCPVVSVAIFELQPGKEFTERWYIDRLFQLEPGKPYSVKLTWAKGMPAKTPSGKPLRQLSRTLTIK